MCGYVASFQDFPCFLEITCMTSDLERKNSSSGGRAWYILARIQMLPPLFYCVGSEVMCADARGKGEPGKEVVCGCLGMSRVWDECS